VQLFAATMHGLQTDRVQLASFATAIRRRGQSSPPRDLE
jgi:hypothetical protein